MRIAHTTETTLDVSDTDFAYYHLTATDFAGNAGEETTTEGSSQGLSNEESIPQAFGFRIQPALTVGGPLALQFDLPRDCRVRLAAFVPTGRRVALLADGRQLAGRHTISWDAREATGGRVPAGVYFLCFQTPGYRQIRRAVVLR
ncbi:MAG: hypothetical protein GF330_09950 [Candidatus Eisenbacteria bacterium]|nr:hypothetical protein [Candidatus Eisenbacteria bacterium]